MAASRKLPHVAFSAARTSRSEVRLCRTLTPSARASSVPGGSTAAASARSAGLSDSPALRAGAAAAFPPGTLLARAPGVSVRHSRTSDLQVRAAENATCGSFLDAAMEHWLFGLADAHVVTAWSGYGRTGALLHVGVGARLRPLFQLPARGAGGAGCGLAAALGVDAVLDMPPGV